MMAALEVPPESVSSVSMENPSEDYLARRDKESEKLGQIELTYHVDDNPPWHLSILYGLQHYFSMLGGTVALPILLVNYMCAANNAVAKSQLICTIFFVSGISTFLQTTFGVRLPIVQGGSFGYLPPTIAILTLPKWKCPKTSEDIGIPNTVSRNMTKLDGTCWKNVCSNETRKDKNTSVVTSTSSPTWSVEDKDIWKPRIREVQGAMIVASLFQIVIGATGIVGLLLNHIGPLTIAPAITLIGLSLFDVASASATKHWGIALMTILLATGFSQYMKDIKVPFPAYSRAKGVHKVQGEIFKSLPILLALIISWFLCLILTLCNVFPKGHPVRTDARSSVLADAPWFRVPYPGQWGTPTVTAAGVVGMLAGVITGIIESIGDYYACARISGAPSVPNHAINRGILMEGFCCMLSGCFGSCSGTTSYSQNIGVIGLTKVGSRRVVQFGGLIMIFLAVVGKFGALFAMVPDPIIGGIFIVMFSMVSAVGISNLQFVNLNSVRNLFIIGFSLFFGLAFPKWISANRTAIRTGSSEFDQVLFVLLGTSMFVGGLVGFLLDVTLPGTNEERGIRKWRESCLSKGDSKTRVTSARTYDIPYVTPLLQRFSFVRYIPFLPYYETEEEEGEGKA